MKTRQEIVAEYILSIRMFLSANGPDEHLQAMLKYLESVD